MHTDQPILAIVVPCYNEEDILQHSFDQLNKKVQELVLQQSINTKSFIVLVNDGSRDRTWEIISRLSAGNSHCTGIKLSKNYGHQNALLAGLEYVQHRSDCAITMDADLQDDINVIGEMVQMFNKGYQIVYGARKSRGTDTFFKRSTANFYYYLLRSLGVNIVPNHADFRLASRNVISHLFEFQETNLFLRGIFPIIGFNSTVVYYDRLERLAGETKYPFKKMLAFAWEGITSFSIRPLRLVTQLGLLVFVICLGFAIYALYSYFFLETVPGWTSITLPLYFLGGIQLLCLGIIGEYLGKVYKEVKRRPRYVVEKVTDDTKER